MSAEAYITSSAIRPLLHYPTENALKIKPADSVAIQKMKSEMKKIFTKMIQSYIYSTKHVLLMLALKVCHF